MKRLLANLLLLICPTVVHAAIVVQGNSTSAPYAFKTDVTAKAYDRKTGIFFVGLADGSDAYTLSKASRPTFSSTPVFQSILGDSSSLTSATIEFLEFARQTTARDALIAVPQGTNAHEATAVTALFTDGSGEITSSNLNDASGSDTTDGIVQIANNSSNIFAAVKPNGSFFGDTNTGISLIGLGATDTTITLNIKDATAGVDGNKAVALDQSSTLLKGTSGGLDVVFSDTQASMYWDDSMERLFIGLEIASNGTATDIAKSVVVGRLSSGILNLQAITPDSAISGGGTDEIIVAEGADIPLSPKHLRVMHASTGPDYLIVNCAQNNVCNRVFALPLVNDTANPTSSTNGTLAKKDSALNSSYKFTTAASSAGDLPENNATTDPEAVVGAGDLPIQASESIADMVVVDDGVYVAISKDVDSSNDSGIWYSQALFDSTGKILRWTPWTKRIIPVNAFPGITLPGGATHSGPVIFLEIDAKTGNVWFVEGDTKQTVGITNWITGTGANDLTTRATGFLSTGCYSVLDLDQSTRGFLGTTTQRYALFGGTNKVVFARTSVANDLAVSSSPQTTITDFSLDENMISTLLPAKAGCCTVLEYSRTSTTADNDSSRQNFCYFFAGTETGLFVFTNSDGDGFDPSNLSTLNLAPFSGRAWYKMEAIKGAVVDIKTSGAGATLYVITSQSTPEEPLLSTLYSIPFTANTKSMFTAGNMRTLARTGVGAFKDVVQFYGVQIVATDDPRAANPENKEQLVLATNQGLFRTDASQAGSASVATATTQTAANWSVVASSSKTTAKTAYNGIAQADTPVRHTSWPFSLQDQSGYLTFDRGSIHQFSGNGDSGGTAAEYNSFFVPTPFNSNSTATAFDTLYRIIYFHSDGGRRFFINNRTIDPPDEVKISVLPFDVSQWNINQPDILNNPTLATIDRFCWIKQIGATGILLAGTDVGVVGLQ